jgi:predicted transcriptional regulator
MNSLLEMTAQIVSSHARTTTMTSEQLLQEIGSVYADLQKLESGQTSAESVPEPETPALTIRQAFRKDEVICLVCNRGGFKTLKKHLAVVHQLSAGEYRKQFGIKSSQKLAARSYSEARSRAAIDMGMPAILAKARATRMARIADKKAAIPAVRIKPQVPAARVKAAVPVKAGKAAAPAKGKSDAPKNKK